MFVANRVAEIQGQLTNVSWCHVPSTQQIVRGLLGSELLNLPTLWWTGPTWLRLSQKSWPTENAILSTNTALEQRVATVQAAHAVPIWDFVWKLSSWAKVIRVTTYKILPHLKFINHCRPSKVQTISTHPKDSALIAAECSHEISALQSSKPISSKFDSLAPSIP